jgi:hypothetical protein
VIVYLWQAGSAEGVTDDHERARRKAARFMRTTGTDKAIVETARYDDGIRSLGAGYAKADGPHWVARRHANGQVTWRLRSAESELAAS